MSPNRKHRKLPTAGSSYEHKYKGKVVRMDLARIKDTTVYRVSGIDYSSPSAAAKSITGTETNGWKFWHME